MKLELECSSTMGVEDPAGPGPVPLPLAAPLLHSESESAELRADGPSGFTSHSWGSILKPVRADGRIGADYKRLSLSGGGYVFYARGAAGAAHR